MQPLDPERPPVSQYADSTHDPDLDGTPETSKSGLGKLGSLGQSARLKQLNAARGILIFVGLLTLAINGFLLASAEQQVDDLIQKEMAQAGPGAILEPGVREQLIGLNRLLFGGLAALGFAFIVLGLAVKKFPVPATLLGLVLYLGANAVMGFLNPASLLSGLIIKVFIVIGLIKAVQAAFAYQQETRAMEAAEGYA